MSDDSKKQKVLVGGSPEYWAVSRCIHLLVIAEKTAKDLTATAECTLESEDPTIDMSQEVVERHRGQQEGIRTAIEILKLERNMNCGAKPILVRRPWKPGDK